MKCRFCGKKIKKGSNICDKCGKEVTEGLGTDELIDAMPELHDEFDNISKMQEKDKKKSEKKSKREENKKKNKKRNRIILAIVLVVAILAVVAAGMLYYKSSQEEDVEPQVNSAIASEIITATVGYGFTEELITDEISAKNSINSAKEALGISDVESEFELEKKIESGGATFYRFKQMYQGIPVDIGEIIIAAASNGESIAINAAYVKTAGLTTTYGIDEGGASTAITEYVNAMPDEYAVVQGVSVTDVEKAVCNSNGNAYLAYKANVSGYNKNGEYMAYDVFVDGISGQGIAATVTSSYENATPAIGEPNYIYEMAAVSDKFNWNDVTSTTAEEKLSITEIEKGNSSEYVKSIKKSVDNAYNYFKRAFDWKGLKGKGESFKVYINSNEYVQETLPSENAMYTNNSLMFFREDLTQGEVDYNTVVHEYAHGVMRNIAGFCGTKEVGENAAIAEGLADVFAELAEAQLIGTSPDWIHKDRSLLKLSEGYFQVTPNEIVISSVEDGYHYSTVVSNMAAIMDFCDVRIEAMNEYWFRVLCLSKRSTNFKELYEILKIINISMFEEGKFTESEYLTTFTCLDTLTMQKAQ